MSKPDWQQVELGEGILREPTPDKNQIVMWVPADCEGGFLHWERISNLPGAEILADREQGVCVTAATSIRARQKAKGLFGKFLQPFRKSADGQTWLLPNGQSAEQVGNRQTDLMLVWAAEGANPLDEDHIQSLWPEGKRVRRIGSNLFVLAGVEQQAIGPAAPQPPPGNPREQAERLLAAARQASDRRGEVSALTDLGILVRNSGDAQRAVALLEEALAIARQLGDRALEGDVLGNLALSMLLIGQPGRALQLLEQQLVEARQAGDRFQEKTALANLGFHFSHVGDQARSLTAYEQALALAREVRDRHHEADLLWYQAIQNAELGQRDRALAAGHAALDLFQQMRNPYVGLLSEHLEKYRTGDIASRLRATAEAGFGPLAGAFGGMWTMESTGMGFEPSGGQAASGPGLLRMALSASKSVAKFVSSGFKTASAATLEKRLRTCATCEHHTGVRCRLCGCFTGIKARMPHENCPIDKWPV